MSAAPPAVLLRHSPGTLKRCRGPGDSVGSMDMGFSWHKGVNFISIPCCAQLPHSTLCTRLELVSCPSKALLCGRMDKLWRAVGHGRVHWHHRQYPPLPICGRSKTAVALLPAQRMLPKLWSPGWLQPISDILCTLGCCAQTCRTGHSPQAQPPTGHRL